MLAMNSGICLLLLFDHSAGLSRWHQLPDPSGPGPTLCPDIAALSPQQSVSRKWWLPACWLSDIPGLAARPHRGSSSMGPVLLSWGLSRLVLTACPIPLCVCDVWCVSETNLDPESIPPPPGGVESRLLFALIWNIFFCMLGRESPGSFPRAEHRFIHWLAHQTVVTCPRCASTDSVDRGHTCSHGDNSLAET